MPSRSHPVLPLVSAFALFAAASLAVSCSSSPAGNGNGSDGGQNNGPVTPPTGFTAMASPSSTKVELTWHAEAAATSGYQVWRSIGGNDLQLDTAPNPSYLDATAPAGTEIIYSVRAVSGSNVSDESAGVTVLTIPGAPSNLAASNVTSTSITISWVEATGSAGGDEISYLAGHGTAITTAATGTTFTVGNLSPSTSVTFTVTARDATGLGPSAVATFSTLGAGLDGGTPTDGGVSDAGSGDDGGLGNNDAGTPTDAGSSDAGGNLPGDGFEVNAYGADSLIIVQWDDQGAASYRVYRAHGTGAYAEIGTTAQPAYADVGGSAHPIVAGDSYSYFIEPVGASGSSLTSSSAGTTTAAGVAVVENDRYVADTTTTPVAHDLSGSVTSALGPSFAVLPNLPDGGPDFDMDDSIQGYGTTDGHAVFPGVPDAGYLLYSQPTLFVAMPATARALDLSTSFIGRPTQTPADATLSLNLTGLDPWDVSGDQLHGLSWGAADTEMLGEPLDKALPAPLADGGTSAAGEIDLGDLFAPGNLIQATHGDVFYVLQQETDDGGTNPYTAVRKGFSTASLTLQANQTSTVSGGLVSTPGQSETLTIDLDPAANRGHGFLAYASAVNPNATFGDSTTGTPSPYGAAAISVEPDYANNGSYGAGAALPQLYYGSYPILAPPAPRLFAGNFTSSTSNPSFGANGVISFTNVFPARWSVFLTAYVPFTVPLNVADVGQVQVVGRLQTQGLFASYASSGSPEVAPKISPVQSAKIGGAVAAASGNTQLAPFSNAKPLVFSWSAPALGLPTRYTVTVWPVDVTGLGDAPAAVVVTSGLSATLPAGQLTSGTNYVAFITATSSDAARFGSGVLAYDGNADSADFVTSSFSMQ